MISVIFELFGLKTPILPFNPTNSAYCLTTWYSGLETKSSIIILDFGLFLSLIIEYKKQATLNRPSIKTRSEFDFF